MGFGRKSEKQTTERTESRNRLTPPATFSSNDISCTEEQWVKMVFSISGVTSTGYPHGENGARHNITELCIVSLSAKRQKDEEGNTEMYLGDLGVGGGFLNRTQRLTTTKEF